MSRINLFTQCRQPLACVPQTSHELWRGRTRGRTHSFEQVVEARVPQSLGHVTLSTSNVVRLFNTQGLRRGHYFNGTIPSELTITLNQAFALRYWARLMNSVTPSSLEQGLTSDDTVGTSTSRQCHVWYRGEYGIWFAKLPRQLALSQAHS